MVVRRISSPVFVGRSRELELLDGALTSAREGTATAVVVSGEAGIGKTRLVQEFTSRARASGARVLVGTCIELGDGELPHAPLTAILRQLGHELEPDRLAVVLGQANRVLDPEAPEALAGRLELVLEMIGRLGELTPAVIVFEDLHWADRSTRDLLTFLIRSLRREPIVLVATYRSDELRRHPSLRAFVTAHAGEVERIELERFTQHEVTQLVAAIRGTTPRPGLITELLTRSEGNAFLVEELLAAGGTDMPDTLREMLIARVDRVSSKARSVVSAAACAGPVAHHRLLAATAGLTEPELGDALREVITHHLLVCRGSEAYAFRHELLREAVYADLLPGERAHLHAAIARALTDAPDLANDSTASRTAELAHHWKAAHHVDEAFAASVAAGRAAARIAAFPEAQRHFEYALDVWDRVKGPVVHAGMDWVDLTRRAAEVANLAADRERAIALARAAADQLDGIRDPVRAALVQERLGRYLWLAGREDEAVAACHEAVATLPADPPTPERARVVAAEGQLLMLSGRAHEAVARCEEALAVARTVGARAEQGHVLNTLGVCRSDLGQHEAGETCLREALAIALELKLFDDIGRAYVNLGDCIDQAGRIEEASRLALDGFEASGSLGLGAGYRSMLLSETASRLFRIGRWDEAERLADRAVALQVGGLAEGSAHATVAQIAAGRGDLVVARAELTRARATFRTGSGMWTAPIDATAAELELAAGHASAARDVAVQGLARTEGQEYPFFTARLHWVTLRVEAELAQQARARCDTSGDCEARSGALSVLQRITDQVVATTGGSGDPAPEVVLYAALCVAELTRVTNEPDPTVWGAPIKRADALTIPALGAYARWRQAEAALILGQRPAAARPLREALTAATRLGARPLAEEIRGLARRGRVELDDPGEMATEDSHHLTEREREVLRLVAAGRTNREIGAELYMSPKTASVHVSHILRKLDARGRVEAIVIARRHGLL
ncbi:MAG TPA: AAA family ATPase [Microlunatus sp.]